MVKMHTFADDMSLLFDQCIVYDQHKFIIKAALSYHGHPATGLDRQGIESTR